MQIRKRQSIHREVRSRIVVSLCRSASEPFYFYLGYPYYKKYKNYVRSITATSKISKKKSFKSNKLIILLHNSHHLCHRQSSTHDLVKRRIFSYIWINRSKYARTQKLNYPQDNSAESFMPNSNIFSTIRSLFKIRKALFPHRIAI